MPARNKIHTFSQDIMKCIFIFVIFIFIDNTSNASSALYSYDEDSTAVVTYFYPNVGTTFHNMTILGQGFTNQTKVTIGSTECFIKTLSQDTIICELKPDSFIEIGVFHPLYVHDEDIGDAIIEISVDEERHFVPLPYITNVFPSEGSLAGGTAVTIEGSGLLVS